MSSRGKVSLTATFDGGRKVRSTSGTSRYGEIPVGFSSRQFESLLGWAGVGLTGDLRVAGEGNLIPTDTNSSPANLIIESPAP